MFSVGVAGLGSTAGAGTLEGRVLMMLGYAGGWGAGLVSILGGCTGAGGVTGLISFFTGATGAGGEVTSLEGSGFELLLVEASGWTGAGPVVFLVLLAGASYTGGCTGAVSSLGDSGLVLLAEGTYSLMGVA